MRVSDQHSRLAASCQQRRGKQRLLRLSVDDAVPNRSRSLRVLPCVGLEAGCRSCAVRDRLRVGIRHDRELLNPRRDVRTLARPRVSVGVVAENVSTIREQQFVAVGSKADTVGDLDALLGKHRLPECLGAVALGDALQRREDTILKLQQLASDNLLVIRLGVQALCERHGDRLPLQH